MLVLIGPSGTGKSTVARELHRRGVVGITPSWTTRPRRADEADGTIEHQFVTDAAFDVLEDEGFFLEVVRPFGLAYRYGLPAVPDPEPGRIPAILARAPMMGLVVRHFPDHLVYQVEDTFDRASARVLAAGSDLGSRLEDFEAERLLGRKTADRVFVNRTSVLDLVEAVATAIGEDFGAERSHHGCQANG